jgi:capsular exopolysaccharide synthesis family protein
MSRIHEALKRAEQERAHARTGSFPASPEPSHAVAALEALAPEPVAPPIANAAVGTSKPAGPWSFEDLLSRRQPHATWNPDQGMDVFDAGKSEHGAEQFRTLRSRLYHIRNQQPLRTLLVTSSMAGEGKTFVTSNLVRSIIRQTERRVLMIDADLRRPRLHTIFGTPTQPGLTDYLRGNVDESAVLQFGETGNLCFIPSGTRVKDPSELLSNGRMKTLLEKLSPAFDWVIIDSAPCLPVADAGVIAPSCDGVLLVVRARYTPSAVIAKSRQELKGRNIVGVVLNAVDGSGSSYGSYYGGGYGESAA